MEYLGFFIVGLIALIVLAPGAVSVAWKMFATITETVTGNTGSLDAGSAAETFIHNAYDESGTLDGSSSPAATKEASFLLTLTSGAATIDLTSLTGLNGATVTGLALKIQILRFKNLGANAMTLAEGASNGYAIGAGIVVPAGGIYMINGANGLPAVASGDKTIDVSGTGAQTAEVTIVFG